MRFVQAIVLILWLFDSPAGAQAGPLRRPEPALPAAHEPDYASGMEIMQVIADPIWLLPDLHTLPPADLEIQQLAGERRLLRLDNTIWNSGPGRLELKGVFNRATRQTTVWQSLYSAEGERLERLAGEFIFHPGHSHWHFEDFALYELWSLTAYGELERVVASSDKLSYCLLDTHIIDRDSDYFARWGEYYICGQATQGLSVGWGDTYDSFLDGQSLDVTALPDGLYALVSTANPTRSVLEGNYDNNSAATFIKLTRDDVKVIVSPELSAAVCLRRGWC